MTNSKDDLQLPETGSMQEFEALFNFASIGIVVTDNQGKITNFNKYAEIKFGYDKSEILGKPVEILLPSSIHHKHVVHREQYYKHPEPRVMGEGRDLYAQSKRWRNFSGGGEPKPLFI